MPKFTIKGPAASIVCRKLAQRIGRRRRILRRIGREAVKAFIGATPYDTGIRKRREPSGKPFAPLKKSTLEVRKRRGINRKGAFILRETGDHIVDAMTILKVKDDSVVVGVSGEENKLIASLHHTGFTTGPDSMIPNKKVPARRIFGMSAKLAKTVNEMIHNHIVRGIQRGSR